MDKSPQENCSHPSKASPAPQTQREEPQEPHSPIAQQSPSESKPEQDHAHQKAPSLPITSKHQPGPELPQQHRPSISPVVANGSYRLHNRGSTNAAVAAASPFFHREQDEAGLLARAKLDELLGQLGLDSANSNTDIREVVAVVAGDASSLTFDQTMAIVSMLQSSLQPSTSVPDAGTSPQATAYNMPLRRMLKQSYMTTGNVDQRDGVVISYLNKLQEHRRTCVEEGRYDEAKVTAERLASLRTQQVERLRQGLLAHQARELADINKLFTEETAKLAKLWKGRVKEYERSFTKSVEELRALHEQQQQQLHEQMQSKVRGLRPSKEYLNHRWFEERLALAREYDRAKKAQAAANRRRQVDALEAQLSFEAAYTIRLTKLTARHQVEMEALLQRGARGRDELELKRLSEVDKKALRFKNVIGELQSLHKLELVQLENWLDAQVQAGKALPLKDSDAYRRRREALCSTEI